MEHEKELITDQFLTHGAIWLIGLLGIGFSYRGERRRTDERDRAEARLRSTSRYTRSLIEASLDPLVTISAEGKIADVNEATEKVTGRSRADLVGTDFSDYFTEPDKARSGYQHAFREGAVTDYPLGIRHRDGRVTEVLYNASVYRDESGKVQGVFAAARDITGRKQAEEALRNSESRYRLLVESAPMCIHEIGMDGRITSMNRAGLAMMGVEEECKVQGFPYLDTVCDADRERIGGLLAKAYAGESSHFEFKASDPDGTIFKSCFVPIKNRDGGIVKLMGITENITERRHAEDRLREKEERLTLATVQNGVGVWDWNLVTQEMIWDDSMFALYHIRREDFIGTEEAWRASLHPDDLQRGDKEVEDAIAGRKPFETEFRVTWPGGEVRYIKAVAKVFRDEQGKPMRMLGINMDITERKLAEEKLRELNNDFVKLLENTGDFIYFKDKDSRIIFCSQTLANITGHASWRDMSGKHDLEIFPPDTARIYYEEELPIFREGRSLLNKTDPYYDEQGKRRWVNTNKWPVFAEDGKTVIGIFGISRDITELKEAEDKINDLNRGLEQRVAERTAQLEAANKELEAFSYSVSHDLRTPLRAIDGFSRILLDEYSGKLDEEGRRLLNIVRENSHKMEQLIDDILKFSRAGRLDMAVAEIDMESLVRAIFDELKMSADVGALQLEIGKLPPAMADRAMLHQVLVNLLSNAIKFSHDKDTPRVEVGGRVEGGEAVYYVKDNGAGFDMQYADKLFGVFQRLHTASEFEGTGIGLAIVKRIVTRHGGRVWAEGRPGEGATIYFSLPYPH